MATDYGPLPSEDNARLGSELSSEDQRYALNCFCHRYTMEHVPQWSRKLRPDGAAYKPHFRTDAEWLANTWFRVTATGRIDKRCHHCHTTNQTWPQGK